MAKKRFFSGGGSRGRTAGFAGMGSATFLGLTDTPNIYTGSAAKVLQVNAGETAVEFVLGKSVPNGFAALDASGKLPVSQLPPLAISDFLGSVASQVAMLALVGENGDWCIRTDLGTVWIVINTPSSILANWQELAYPATPSHDLGGGVHIADTIANIQTKVSDGSLITTAAGEINALPAKLAAVNNDLLMIEDSADVNKKKSINVSGLPFPIASQIIDVSHIDFQIAALTKSNTLFSLPAGGIVIGMRLKPSVTFLGGAISSYFLSIGIAGGTGDLLAEYDSMNIVVSDTEYAEAFAFQSFNYGASVNLLITARSIGANLLDSTQGAAKIEVYYIPRKF